MLDQTIDLSPLRSHFPALQQSDENGRPYVYFDGPGGTQVPQVVIDAMGNLVGRIGTGSSGTVYRARALEPVGDVARGREEARGLAQRDAHP